MTPRPSKDILNLTWTQRQTSACIHLAELTLNSFSDDIQLGRNNSAVHSCPCWDQEHASFQRGLQAALRNIRKIKCKFSSSSCALLAARISAREQYYGCDANWTSETNNIPCELISLDQKHWLECKQKSTKRLNSGECPASYMCTICTLWYAVSTYKHMESIHFSWPFMITRDMWEFSVCSTDCVNFGLLSGKLWWLNLFSSKIYWLYLNYVCTLWCIYCT